jgi:hypothetical protein
LIGKNRNGQTDFQNVLILCYCFNDTGVRVAVTEATRIDLNQFKSGKQDRDDLQGLKLRDTYDAILTVMEKKKPLDDTHCRKRDRSGTYITYRPVTPDQRPVPSSPSPSGSSAESTLETESQDITSCLLRDVLFIGARENRNLSWLEKDPPMEIHSKYSLETYGLIVRRANHASFRLGYDKVKVFDDGALKLHLLKDRWTSCDDIPAILSVEVNMCLQCI